MPYKTMDKEDFYKRSTLPTLIEEGDSLPVPKFIGPYKVQSLLSKGGMSLLYLGTHPDTGAPTTIKVLSKKFLSRPDVTKRFLDEAEIIAMADHPNIVHLYGHGEWEGGLYIAMEFIEGITLRQYLLRRPLSLRQALSLIVDIGYALCHLHSHGVIHRDLKLENVLVTNNGSIKVIDFGIAQLLKESVKPSEPTPRIIGTPIYMSPEQQKDPESVSYPSDIYSLGIIAYELILGKLCHGRIHLSLMPKGVQKYLAKALQPDPKTRYQETLDFVSDITEYAKSASLEEDSPPHDQFSELHEGMKLAIQTFVPETTPLWHRVKVGMATHRSERLSALYYDFFKLSTGSFGLLTIEPVNNHASALIGTAVVRGLIQALKSSKIYPPEIFISELNAFIINDIVHQNFFLNYLILNPNENSFQFISCGSGSLFLIREGQNHIEKITSMHPLIGEKTAFPIHHETAEWKPGDTLILNTLNFALEPSPSENAFKQLLSGLIEKNISLPPKQQVDNIVGSLSTMSDPALQKRTLALISMQRQTGSSSLHPPHTE